MVPKGTTYKELSHKSKGLEGGEPPAPGNIPAEADRWVLKKLPHWVGE